MEKKICAYCGFGIPEVLETAHIDGNHENNDPKNLVTLCPTCHRLLDIDLIAEETIIEIRDRPWKPNWKKLIKDGTKKAWETRRKMKT
jgi:5-methylcytosine-specific restriction endonuclease McrA